MIGRAFGPSHLLLNPIPCSRENNMSNEHSQPLTIRQQMERGRCIARLYIAAQHLSETASTAALDLLETASPWEQQGFDQEMAKSPFPVRCRTTRGPLDPSPFMKSVANSWKVEQQIQAMITPPWMNA